ncbi:MAG: long-chain-fatty-acid--CoA ligase [Antricoccus sp.]
MTTTTGDARSIGLGAQGLPIERLADILRQRVAATPTKVALRENSGDTSFAELDARSSQFAQALLAAGVKAGDRVAMVCANDRYFVEFMFGATKMGAIPAPINLRLVPAELRGVLSVCEPTLLYVGAGCEALMPAPGDIPGLQTLLDTAGYEKLIAGHSTDDPGYQAGASECQLIQFSSGTTGQPKGIMLSGRNFSAALTGVADRVDIDENAIAMAPVPFFHITGLVLALTAINKGSILLLKMPAGPADLIRLLVEEGVTHAVGVPTLIQMISQSPAAKDADWSKLKYFVYGGAPMPRPAITAATEVLECGLIQGYGMTETTAGVTTLWPEDHLPQPGRDRVVGSVGRPMDGVEIRIVDPATGRVVQTDERGEVQIRGPWVTQGYFNRPEETAAALVGDGWLRTGDGGSLDADGYLYLHDRIKDMIVSGGENVYPAEIESVLSAHPDIAEVGVIGIPSHKWGESPHAVVVPKPGSHPTEVDIIAWSRENMAHFKCPVSVSFVGALPRNPSGKILKRALREGVAELP